MILYPPIIIFLVFGLVGIHTFIKKPSVTAINIQNKYRKKRGKSPMNDNDMKILHVKHRIVGITFILMGTLYLVIFQ